MWIWVWILKGASKTPTRLKKSPNCAADDGSIISTIGPLFSFDGVFNASLKIALLQAIVDAPPEPSLCASGVLLILPGFQNHAKNTPYRGVSVFGATSKRSAFPMPSRTPPRRNGGSMMRGRRHVRHPGKQALASVPPHGPQRPGRTSEPPAHREV